MHLSKTIEFQNLDQAIFDQMPAIQSVQIPANAYHQLIDIWPELQIYTKPHKSLDFDLARLDQLDEHISGNKWMKMRDWIQQRLDAEVLESMGGSHSNHLVAFAAACYRLGIKARCFVRANGSGTEVLSTPTLELLHQFNAEICPLSRSDFREFRQHTSAIFLPEGGRSWEAMASISSWVSQHISWLSEYEHLYTASGTGTWLAGLVAGFFQCGQQISITSAPAVAGQKWLASDIETLLKNHLGLISGGVSSLWNLDWSFPQKGFQPMEQNRLQKLYDVVGFPLDPVYMPRILFVLVQQWLEQNIAKKILVLHSGGLQALGSLKSKQFHV